MLALRKGSWQPVHGGLKFPDTKTMQMLTRHKNKYLWNIVLGLDSNKTGFSQAISTWGQHSMSGKALQDLQREDVGLFCLFGGFCCFFFLGG